MAKWLKMLWRPVCGRLSYFDYAFTAIDKNEAAGCAIIDGDWIHALIRSVYDAVKDCKDTQMQTEIADAIVRFIRTCHCGNRAYELINNTPELAEIMKMTSHIEAVNYRKKKHRNDNK